MRDEIKNLLSDLMPAVDFEADFLFSHLDSLSIATILYVLNDKYGITLGVEDVTPRNFKNLDNLVRMVQSKRSMEARIQHFAETAPDTVAAVQGEKKRDPIIPAPARRGISGGHQVLDVRVG